MTDRDFERFGLFPENNITTLHPQFRIISRYTGYMSSMVFWGHQRRRLSVEIIPTQKLPAQTLKRGNYPYTEYQRRRLSVEIIPTQTLPAQTLKRDNYV